VPAIDDAGAPAPPADRRSPSPRGCGLLPAAEQRCSCLREVLLDWASLGRHAAANAAAHAAAGAAAPAAGRVVLFGESIIQGWARAAGGGLSPDEAPLDRGVEGQTTEQMLVRFRQDVLELRPRVVVIGPGFGDLLGETGKKLPSEIQYNVETMTALARLHGLKVVLTSLPPVTDAKRGPDGVRVQQTAQLPPDHIVDLNAWLAGHARQRGFAFVDLHAALADPSGRMRADLTDDGLHPNTAGYVLLTPLIKRAIATSRR
jgi:lysophospholipase L1-like esterase